MFLTQKTLTLSLLTVSLVFIGCGTENLSASDSRSLLRATAQISDFCDVVDGDRSVSLSAYNKLDSDSSKAVKKLLAIYRKYPEATVITEGNGSDDGQSIYEELDRVRRKLSTCDPKEANKIAGALTATREP